VYNVCTFYKIVAGVWKGSKSTWQSDRTLNIILGTSVICKRCRNGAA